MHFSKCAGGGPENLFCVVAVLFNSSTFFTEGRTGLP